MHIFLQGPRNVGKSTVIRKTLDIMEKQRPLNLGGFFTWNGGESDPHIYIRPAAKGREEEVYRVASYDPEKGGINCDLLIFEREGTSFIEESTGADLIIMDELGFLESRARDFKAAVIDAINGTIPIFGVMRLGDVLWHEEIKRNPKVTLFDVNEETRNDLITYLLRTI